MSDSNAYELLPGDRGAFRLSAAGKGGVLLSAVEDGWRVEGPGVEGWRLLPSADPGGGFVLIGAPTVELGRTCRMPGPEPRAGEAVVVLGDGRMYRSVLRGPVDPRVELVGWETPGPYLVARPAARAWALAATAAGEHLLPDDAMLILFAAEVLAAAEGGPSRPDSGDA